MAVHCLHNAEHYRGLIDLQTVECTCTIVCVTKILLDILE